MPLQNLGKLHLTAAQITTVDTALASVLGVLQTVSPNFDETDRLKYGSVNELNKLLVNKANDFHKNQPALQSPDVDWAEFDADYADRSFADTRLNTANSIIRLLIDFKIAHDFDNYQDALTDYQYAQYKANTNTPGYAEKVSEMKQFFPRTFLKSAAKTENPNP
jgi:hypothetical protein